MVNGHYFVNRIYQKKKKMPHEAHEHFVPLNSILFNGL